MYRFTILTFVTLSFVISAVYALEDALTSVRQRTRLRARQFTDHPDWTYLNNIPWYKLDSTQQDHVRFHCYLAMSAYGDYASTCPRTFQKGFTVLQSFDGGYIAKVPEMNKVVIVLRGNGNYQSLDWSPTTIEDLVSDCSGCQVARGIKNLYLSIKSSTDDFAVFKNAINQSGLRSSVTGHGIGGSIAALAAMDLGARGFMHYSHNSGAPRSFNMASVVKYDNLFQVLAGQSVVSRNDYSVQIIPRGPLYHIGQKVHITGDKTQWLTNCFGNNENPNCLGAGNSEEDHKYYFTPIGQCGSADKGF